MHTMDPLKHVDPHKHVHIHTGSRTALSVHAAERQVESTLEALRCIRWTHLSMLTHVSMFTYTQDRVPHGRAAIGVQRANGGADVGAGALRPGGGRRHRHVRGVGICARHRVAPQRARQPARAERAHLAALALQRAPSQVRGRNEKKTV
eukprot:1192252-Prorocentrum_minimum.AAC.1